MAKALFVISIIVTLAFGFILVPNYYSTNRDTDALIDRAQVAANAADMLEYVTELDQNMARIGMTSGHTALVFKTPANDLGQVYKAVQRIEARLSQIKELPQDGTVYQVALSDLRGTLRELRNPTDGYMWVNYIWWMLLVLIVLWVLTLVAFEHEY